MTVLALARKYYPRLWSRDRIEALAAAGRLSQEDADRIFEDAPPAEEPGEDAET